MLTDSVIYVIWNFPKFRSSKWLLKTAFSQTVFVFEDNWRNSNFQSSNSLLTYSILFANTFRVRDNLIYLRFNAWLACLRNSNFSQNDSAYQVYWNNSKFKSMNSHIQNPTFLRTDSFCEKNLLYFKVSKLQFANRFCH